MQSTTQKPQRCSLAQYGWLLPLAITVAVLVPRCFASSRVTPVQGSWHFPTGGPYRLALGSDVKTAGANNGVIRQPIIGAKLWVDGKLVFPCGERKLFCRHVFTAGVYDYVVEGPSASEVWLLWQPPGRRGLKSIEYVPPSSLSPLPAREAKFAYPDAYIGDGIRCVVVGIVWLFWLFWRRRKQCDYETGRNTIAVGTIIFVFALAIRLLSLSGAGQTWDEDANWAAGRNYVQNILNAEFSEARWQSNFEHPPVTKYVAGLGSLWDKGYGVSRLLSALLGSLACVFLFFTGRNLFSQATGVIAGLTCSVLPHAIAHSRIVGHETLSLFMWAIGLWFVTRKQKKIDKGLFVGMGVVVGIACGVRFINGLLGVAMALSVLCVVCGDNSEHRIGKSRWRMFASKGWFVVRSGMVWSVPAAILTLVALWPRLWHGPISRLVDSWRYLSRSHGSEPYHGVFASEKPWYYFIDYWWATTPLLVVVLVVGYVGFDVVKRKGQRLVLLGIWFVVPHLAMLSPVKQDGMRYVLPCLLVTSLAAASAVTHVSFLFRRRRNVFRVGIAAVVLVYSLLMGARVAPYYLDFYGVQVGGMQSVARHHTYEVAWWGEGLQKGVEHINHNALPNDKVWKPWACVPPAHMAWLRADLWSRSRRSNAQWLLVYAPLVNGLKKECQPREEFTLVFEHSIQGIPLISVYRRTPR